MVLLPVPWGGRDPAEAKQAKQQAVDKMLLSETLLDVRRALVDEAPRLRSRLVRVICRSRMSLVGNTVFTLVVLWELLHTPAAVALRVPLRLLVGAYSCTVAMYVWAFRMPVIRVALDKAVAVARALEQRGGLTKIVSSRTLSSSRSPLEGVLAGGLLVDCVLADVYGALKSTFRRGQVRLQAAASRVRRIMRFFSVFTTLSSLSVIGTFILDGSALTAVGGWFAYQAVGSIVAFYSLVPLQLSLFTSVGELLAEAPRPLTVEGGRGPMDRVAELLGRTYDLCRIVDRVWRPLVPHLLLTVVAMPMVSTVEVVVFRGEVDAFAATSLPVFFFVFVPLCLAGQRIQDANQTVPGRCYSGPWLSEPPVARRTRLMLMQAGSRRCAVHVYTSCAFDRPTCGEALRKWFSYMQMVVNLTSR